MRKRFAVVVTTLAAAASVGLSATPSQAQVTGALVMGPQSTSTIVVTVRRANEFQISNIDTASAHTLTVSGLGINTTVPKAPALGQPTTVTSPTIGATTGVYPGTVDGSTLVFVTVADF
jgi:hypothetical protein